jgi:RHS repeat-associated protein
MTDTLGGTNTLAYDAVGNLIRQTDELGRTSTYTYNSRNWLTSITDPLNHTSTRTYDAVGNILSTADALGHTTTYSYDALNRKVSTTDATGQTTLLSYDLVGNLLSLSDPEQNKTSYTYDALDRQLTDTNPLGLSRTYTYDAVGNQTSMVDRNGRRTTYTYDALDRQTQENWLDATNTAIRTTTRSYDAASQLIAIGDPDSRYAYTYDPAGRLTSVDNTGTPNAPSVILGYTYDAVNNRLTTTDTINGQLKGTETYLYDALDRITRITQSGNGVTNKRVDLSYDAASQMTGIARFSDLLGTLSVANSDYSYDLTGRLTRLSHKRSTTTYADYQWTYDAANRITQFISPDGTSNYSYDNRDQLTGTDHSYQSDEAYGYDANGNRTNAGYQNGTNNQLLSDGTYSYSYDNEGNRTRRTNIATGEVTEYAWDYHNRLTGVVTKNSAGAVIKTVTYSYDAYDRRIAKVIDLDGSGSAMPTTERMVYDGDNIALTFDGNGTQTHRYLFGPGIDQVLADETQTSVNWALVDNQGTVRDVIDSNGVVLNHISYDSFGNVTGETNPNVEFRYGYTGRERDEETGLYYYRTRYYDPIVGKFISEDTIGFNGGDANLSRYVGNNSINLIDPYGRSWLNNVDNWLADRGVDLYGTVNTLDQGFGGFGSGATGGATDIIREKIYGGNVNDNQHGALHDGASIAGDVASDFVPGGKGGKLVKAGRGLLDNSRKASDLYRKAQSVDRILKGCGTLDDLEELAGGLGNNRRRRKSGGNPGSPPVSGIGSNKGSLPRYEGSKPKYHENDAHVPGRGREHLKVAKVVKNQVFH